VGWCARRWAPLAAVAVAAALAACGDDRGADIVERLQLLPDVVTVEVEAPTDASAPPGYRYFDLWFIQPLDPADAGAGGAYVEYAALMHHDDAAPLVVYTSGYDAGRTRTLSEPAALLGANQISIEYRFYGSSRPEDVEWPALDVERAAADEHHIVEELATVYPGARIATGGSKGGEAALFHAFLYPGDYDGVVAYVAPVITDLPDQRYATVLDDIGTPDCRDRLRALQREMLTRRAAMEARAAADGSYRIAGVGKATETAIVELEFAFWMTRGISYCGSVPDPSVGDDALYAFLADVSPPAGYDDASTITFGEQYTYQVETELGYPVWDHDHLDDLLQYSYEDWSAFLPAGVPTSYDPDLARGLATWLATSADRVLLIEGQWDPWGAGYPTLGAGRDAYALTVPYGSHWSSGIWSLDATDQATALGALSRWTGVKLSADRPLAAPAPRRHAVGGVRAPW